MNPQVGVALRQHQSRLDDQREVKMESVAGDEGP